MSRREEYSLLEVIGKGAFATVWKALHKRSNITVAAKVIRKECVVAKMRSQLVREVEAMKRIDHPNVVRFYDAFETENELFIISEFVGGQTLLEKINDEGSLAEPEVRRLFCQLVSAIDYLHSTARIVHRDLKCENILLDRSGNIRIIDFGLSNILETDDSLFETKCGSPGYVAPEIVNGKMYSKSTDIWSLGVILYVMANGEMPFSSDNLQVLLRKITLEKPEWNKAISAGLVNMNRGLLEKKPMDRLTIEEIKAHSWFALNEYVPSSSCGVWEDLDETVVDKVEKMGYNVTTLKSDLNSGVCTDATAAYRILEAKAKRMDGNMVSVSKIGCELQKKAGTFTPMSRPKLKMLLPLNSARTPRGEMRIRVATRRVHPMAHRVAQLQ